MSPLEVLQLVGYSIGAVLPLWLAVLLLSRRRKLAPLERILFVLALSIGGWHTSNLFITFHNLFGLTNSQWTTLLRLADTVAVVCITFTYSFLLDVHAHLWANATSRPLTRREKLGVFASYVPTLFLVIVLPKLWTGAYAPMLTKLSFFVLPFAVWVAYVLGMISIKELLIAKRSPYPSEQRIMRALAASFITVGVVIIAALALGFGKGTWLRPYVLTVANLGSLLPSALLVYYIYRYRYLELVIEESLIVATFAAFILVIYLYGIRTIGERMTARFHVRAGVIEAVLILALTLAAAPMRRWLESRFHKLFAREATLYREIAARISSHAGQYKELPGLLRFVEERTTQALALREVRILISDRGAETGESGQWIEQLLRLSKEHDWEPVDDEPALTAHGYSIAYPLRREERTAGLLLADGPSGSLTPDARAVLALLADQIAIAIEDCRLVEENVRLERQLADQERLAALGQMAATVAHEIKNPLSSIKSIAQVMSEDAQVSSEYSRDLGLIVGETDRLSQSVTQLLSFARRESPAELPCRVEELVASVVGLFRPEAEEQGITVECAIECDEELDGVAVSAVRDSLANLLLNAVQATPAGGRVIVEAKRLDRQVLIAVLDGGPGIPTEIQQRIWEPFFTTKQRGTGLGLAIVRKRMEEAGGSARLARTENGQGARFELRVPIADP